MCLTVIKLGLLNAMGMLACRTLDHRAPAVCLAIATHLTIQVI